MGFLESLFGGSRSKKLIDALSFESPSDSGRWRHGTTWATRRDAAAALGASGDRQAVAPLRDGMKDALAHLRWMRGEFNASEVERLMQWPLRPLVHHSESEWQSLPARTGSALSIIHIGAFEWAWATAVIHAESLARLGDQAAPQDLLEELRQIDGAQWKNAETLLLSVKAQPAVPVANRQARETRKATSREHWVLRCGLQL